MLSNSVNEKRIIYPWSPTECPMNRDGKHKIGSKLYNIYKNMLYIQKYLPD
jgi:hypothetical protein